MRTTSPASSGAAGRTKPSAMLAERTVCETASIAVARRAGRRSGVTQAVWDLVRPAYDRLRPAYHRLRPASARARLGTRIGILVALATGAFWFDLTYAERHGFFDLQVYYGAINYWAHGGGSLYDYLLPLNTYGFT